tara:strand:- start:9 stop:233 length:225 start_codon:yes stop_codon:yes gene_type:complete
MKDPQKLARGLRHGYCFPKHRIVIAVGRKMNKQWVEQLRKEFTKETGIDWRNEYFQDWLKRKLLPKTYKPRTLH